MFVAVARVDLHIPAATSLKDKRRVVQSVSKRLTNQFPVSIAEISAQEHWGLAVLGMAVVSGSASHAREVVEAVFHTLERMRLDAEVGSAEIDVIAAF